MKYPEILSLTSGPMEVAYTKRDAILYALGVGVGLETLDDDDLSFVYEKDLRVLPTFSTTLLGQDSGLLVRAGIDLRMILHSEQCLVVHNPLPPEGRILATSRIANVADKGKDKGAVVNTEYMIADAETGLAYSTVTLTIYCRGEGGFGGPSEDLYQMHQIPERAADREISFATASNQAALYRMAIHDATQLHIDPEFARQVGFEKPLLHGLCIYGFAARAVMKMHCGNDPTRIRSFDVRFAAPFFPGETLVTRSWQDGNVISFECTSGERGVTVFRNGRCEIA
ncbi:MAG: MaoC/PaaZ C-terminal domain-containing protein [Novosphingobium sp.]